MDLGEDLNHRSEKGAAGSLIVSSLVADEGRQDACDLMRPGCLLSTDVT